MALENSMLVMNGKQVGGNTQDLTGYQTKVDNNLETESKEIVEAINALKSEKADTDMVAADFNTGTSYTAGNYCIYDGKFYKFKNDHSGAWSAADVDEIKIAGELSALKSGLTNLNNYIIERKSVVSGDKIPWVSFASGLVIWSASGMASGAGILFVGVDNTAISYTSLFHGGNADISASNFDFANGELEFKRSFIEVIIVRLTAA